MLEPIQSGCEQLFADSQTLLRDKIASDIYEKGYSINPNALCPELTQALYQHAISMPAYKFEAAGIGRQEMAMQNTFVRTDQICWITGESDAGKQWLHWCEQLRQEVNRKLFLGLNYFESHFAHYRPGDFYKRHMDAFKGQRNRVLTMVVYLNHQWGNEDGGELVMYQDKQDMEGLKVIPGFGTVVSFLSEDFPHEVLPSNRDRLSIAGWFRQDDMVLPGI